MDIGLLENMSVTFSLNQDQSSMQKMNSFNYSQGQNKKMSEMELRRLEVEIFLLRLGVGFIAIVKKKNCKCKSFFFFCKGEKCTQKIWVLGNWKGRAISIVFCHWLFGKFVFKEENKESLKNCNYFISGSRTIRL